MSALRKTSLSILSPRHDLFSDKVEVQPAVLKETAEEFMELRVSRAIINIIIIIINNTSATNIKQQ